MIQFQFDEAYFFRWVETQPPTRWMRNWNPAFHFGMRFFGSIFRQRTVKLPAAYIEPAIVAGGLVGVRIGIPVDRI